jgi:RHS repeat-associated protein
MIQAEVHGKKPVAFAFNGDDQRIARFLRNHRHIRSAKSKGKGKSCDDEDSDGQWLLNNWQRETGYTYSGSEVLAEFDSKNKISSSYTSGLGIDDHISVTRYKGNRRAETYYYVSDALGFVKKIKDHRGKTVNSYNYTPYGEAYNIHEKIIQPYRYTGRRWDPNVGKLWYRSRHYAPGVGRFSQADKWNKSVMNPVGFHAYGYVQGNPVLYRDPYGKFIFTGTAIAIGGVTLTPAVINAVGGSAFALWLVANKDRLAKSASNIYTIAKTYIDEMGDSRDIGDDNCDKSNSSSTPTGSPPNGDGKDPFDPNYLTPLGYKLTDNALDKADKVGFTFSKIDNIITTAGTKFKTHDIWVYIKK